MPYSCKAVGNKYHLTKKGSDTPIGTHDSRRSCIAQMRAIYANETTNQDNLIFDGYIVRPWNFEEKLQTSSEITLVINSQGGDFVEAITMHNAIRNSGKKSKAFINPFAVSAAAVLALAADEIYMPENGLMMFHRPMAKAEAYGNSEELGKVLAGLQAAESVLVKTLMSKTKKTEEECRKIMENDTYYTAEQALAEGIIDEIIPIYRDVGNFTNYGFPVQIVNFLTEKRDMPLQELCKKFNVADETALENLITQLQNNQKPAPREVSPALVNLLKQTREQSLNGLVDNVTGARCAPEVVNELKLEFLNENNLKIDAMMDDPNVHFNKVVTAIGKNPPIVNFKEKTGGQQTPEGQEQESPLVKKMRDRAKEYYAREAGQSS